MPGRNDGANGKTRLCGGRAYRVFEIGPAEDERASEDRVIDRCDAKDAHQLFDPVARERGAPRLLEQVEDGGHPVRRDETTPVAIFDGRPQCRGRIGAGPTLED